MLNSHPMPDLQERPGLAGQSGFNSCLDCGKFVFVNSNRGPANSDYVNNPRDGKNWEPVQWVKPAKHVTGEEGKLDFFKPI